MAENGKSMGKKIAVCGHIAIDIIPELQTKETDFRLTPGSLIEVGGAMLAAGGAVSNTGIALHRLGANVQLMGKVGDDLWGDVTIRLLQTVHTDLIHGIVRAKGELSSYTLVLNPPDTDRIFLHCPGTNDTFREDDISYEGLQDVHHFHFGYPPLMKQMYADGGVQLCRMLERITGMGLTTSLDMAMPGAGTLAYEADWPDILKRVLPHVTLFMPSLEELMLMARKCQYEAMIRDSDSEAGDRCERISVDMIRELAEFALGLGCEMVVIKLGVSGLYLRSSEACPQAASSGDDPWDMQWKGRELWAPCFQTVAVGTTGAGDCTIAGFLHGWLNKLSPEEVMTGAVAVGACSVESADATGGIVPWETVWRRVRSGWERLPVKQVLTGWRWDEDSALWHGPFDARESS
ncbi:MAG: carbohydrate kinase family protein [Paenibacillaceae bacterium]